MAIDTTQTPINVGSFMERAGAVSASSRVSAMFAGMDSTMLDNEDRAQILKVAIDTLHEEDPSKENGMIQESIRYFDTAMNFFQQPEAQTSSALQQDMVTHLAELSRSPNPGSWMDEVLQYFRTTAAGKELEEMLAKQRDNRSAIAAVLAENALQEEAYYGAIRNDLEKEAERILAKNADYQKAKDYLEKHPDSFARAERIIADSDKMIDALINDSDLMSGMNKERLEHLRERFGHYHSHQLHLGLKEILDDTDLTFEERQEKITNLFEKVQTQEIPSLDAIGESVFTSLYNEYPQFKNELDKLKDASSEYAFFDAQGHFDQSKFEELIHGNPHKEREALQAWKEFNDRGGDISGMDPERVQLALAMQVHKTTETLLNATNPAMTAKIIEISKDQALMDKLLTLDPSEQLDLLKERGYADSAIAEVGFQGILASKDGAGFFSKYAQAMEGEERAALRHELRTELASNTVLLGDFARTLHKEKNDIATSIERARGRYTEGTPLRAELETWVKDLQSINGPQKAELFSRFASGEFSVDKNGSAFSPEEALQNARKGRFELLGKEDAIVTNLRIAESKKLADLSPGNKALDVPNGHEEYYQRFNEEMTNLGIGYATYTPPTKGESEADKNSRMETNMKAADALLAGNRNADGVLNADKLFIPSEVREELYAQGKITLEEAETIRGQGKKVYNSLKDTYLQDVNGQKNELLAIADGHLEKNKPLAEWGAEARMAHMIRTMHVQSEMKINLHQFANVIRETALSPQEINGVLREAYSQPTALGAVQKLGELTQLNFGEKGTLPSQEVLVFSAVGLIAIREQGDNAAQFLSNLAYDIEGDLGKQTDAVLGALITPLLPEGVTMQDLQKDPTIMPRVSRFLGEKLKNGEPLPSKEELGAFVAEAASHCEAANLSTTDLSTLVLDLSGKFDVASVDGSKGFSPTHVAAATPTPEELTRG